MSIHSDFSQASTKLGNGSPAPSPTKATWTRTKIKHVVANTNAKDVFLFLLGFRILNALCVNTFFQPDEFFQSLEPAWYIVFGRESGAWLTWEWRNQLRSAIHPSIFAGAYWLANVLARVFRIGPASHADLLIAAPKTLQALFAAVQDYYTFKFAQGIYGYSSNDAWAVLVLTVISPWQWFCSTRTFSNGLETTLTIVALYFWPWHWLPDALIDAPREPNGVRMAISLDNSTLSETAKLRRCLLFAGLACILRPTNILIWIPLAVAIIFEKREVGWLVSIPKVKQNATLNISYPSIRRNTQNESVLLIREAAICGSIVLAVSVFVDRMFYQTWAFPPLKFLLFNVVQSLAVFYGRNRWDYYITEGFPLLLTTALPFALIGLARGFFNQLPRRRSTKLEVSTLRHLTLICLILPFVLSLIAHKEVRFIYPLLPALHIITAPVLVSYFRPAVLDRPPPSPSPRPPNIARPILLKRLLLGTLLALNFIIAVYTTRVHAPGPINVLSYLRSQYLTYYTPQVHPTSPPRTLDLFNPPENDTTLPIMTVGFLMPCHSTPWRSHLIFPSIHAWSLTCEPPLTVPLSARSTYVDEADQFYANANLFIKQNMSRHPPRPRGIFALSSSSQHRRRQMPPYPDLYPTTLTDHKTPSPIPIRKEWPDYLIFFAQLEPTLDVLLRGSGYSQCWRGFNSHFHDDWRRTGDIVAWCLFPERRVHEPSMREHGTAIAAPFIRSARAGREQTLDVLTKSTSRLGATSRDLVQWARDSLVGLAKSLSRTTKTTNNIGAQARHWWNKKISTTATRATAAMKQKQRKKAKTKTKDLWS